MFVYNGLKNIAFIISHWQINARKALMLFCLVFICCFSKAAIVVSSVSVTSSTCPNNGTATVYASSNSANAALYYALGPGYSLCQHDSVFRSLYPGNYTARVYDLNSFDSAQVSFTITGNYQLPSFVPVVTPALCSANANGSIFGRADSTKGKLPFTWQITSPVNSAPQNNDVFNLLPTDTYTLRLTDACQNIQTKNVIVPSLTTGLDYVRSYYRVSGCNAVIVSVSFNMDSVLNNLPLQMEVTTAAGTYVKQKIPRRFFTYDSYDVIDTVYNVSYGDYLKVCLIDTCGLKVCSFIDRVPEFNFTPQVIGTNSACSTTYYLGFITPDRISINGLNITMRDSLTGTIVADSTFRYAMGMNLNYAVTPGRWYTLKVTDTCGNAFTTAIQVPLAPAPTAFIRQNCERGMLDSTGTCQFVFSNFSSKITFKIVSGPTVASSTTPKFAYYDTIIYPRTIPMSGSWIYVNNFPPGTYQCEISDSCGNFIDTSFSIRYTYVKRYESKAVRACDGSFTWNIFAHQSCNVPSLEMRNTVNNAPVTIFNHPNSWWHSAYNLQPGIYTSSTKYDQGGPSFFGPYQWTVRDTLVVPAITNVLVKSSTTFQCHGQIYLDVLADSLNGVPPFKYEIINGPQTFPLQNTGLFQLPAVGTYLTRIIDSCGNSNTLQITADTARVDSVFKNGNLCVGNMVKLSALTSPYFTHIWQRPGGGIYVGDTLTIYPFSMADTGNYLIKKVVYINGCRDTFATTFRLGDKDISYRSDTICAGTVLQIGNYTHTVAGTYTDVLLNQTGCDSFVVVNLNLKPVPVASITPLNPEICFGRDTILTASGGFGYSWNSGQVTGAINTSALSVTDTFTVTVSGANGCSSIQSSIVTVHHPQVSATANATTVCSGDSASVCASSGVSTYQWNTGATTNCIAVNTSGSYLVTATDAYGCTAQSNRIDIVAGSGQAVNITADKVRICATNSANICAPSGYAAYLWNNGVQSNCISTSLAGNYYVTVTDNNGCTAESNRLAIQVIPLPPVSVSVNGDSLSAYNAVTYQWLINGDTIPNATSNLFIATESGSYQVAVTDTNGCNSVSNAIIINVTGIDEQLSESSVKIYPNPNMGLFTLSLSSSYAEKVEIKTSNLLGETISETSLIKSAGLYTQQINLSGVAKGVYFLQIKLAGRAVIRKVEIY